MDAMKKNRGAFGTILRWGLGICASLVLIQIVVLMFATAADYYWPGCCKPYKWFISPPIAWLGEWSLKCQEEDQKALDEFFSVSNLIKWNKEAVTYEGEKNIKYSNARLNAIIYREGNKLDKWNKARTYALDTEGLFWREGKAVIDKAVLSDVAIDLAAKYSRGTEEFGKAYMDLFPAIFPDWRAAAGNAVLLNPAAAKRHGLILVAPMSVWLEEQAKQVAVKEKS